METSPMNILYVEDEPNDAQLVAMYVRSTPHDLVLANDTGEAEVALLEEPGLIMLDLMLHHVRAGFGFARELREQGFTQPIVAVTALSTPDDIEECRKSGFDDVLVKPFTISQLADVIQRYTV